MATTLSADHKIYATYPIVKFEESPDGLVVYGKATDGSIDSDEQVVDPEWSSKALGNWLSSGGNVRVQHNPKLYPAGKGLAVELDRDGDGGHWVKSLIVEDTAKKLVKAGVLRAYSVGISRPVIKRDVTGKARGGIVTGGDDTEIAEISLVDRPANRNCSITLMKGAGMDGDWSTGDLDALLEEAEKVEKAEQVDDEITKAKKPPFDEAEDEDDNESEGDEDFEDADEDEEVVKSAWREERTEWLAREPRPDGETPHTGTAFLAKRAAWEKWHAEGEDAGLDDAADAYIRWLAKRNMDPNVGGGVDRDKIPASNFVDPDGRRFPIVKPGDVFDAVSSFGRAKPLIPMSEFKERLVSIAHRLGEAFVSELPAAWSTKADEPEDMVVKGMKACPNPNCDADYHADSKMRRCEECGFKLPKAKNKAKKSEKAVDVVDKSNAPLPADTMPAGEHREPDGNAVEMLEHDAGMHTDPDAVHDKVPASVKSISASPYQVQRMHDALCAAFDWDTVAAEYPSLKSVADAVVPGYFTDQVQAAALKGDMLEVTSLAHAALTAEELHKGDFDPAAVADGRAALHKSFADMYPNTRVALGSITPGQFQRPYISAGHAPESAPASRPANVPPSSRVPDPNDFDRPLITAGHEAESPGDRGDNLRTNSVSSGSARQFYTNASKDAARMAMQAMHDHICQTFPDMCPMAASKSVMPADMGDTNTPHPVQALEVPKAPGEKAVAVEVKKTKGLGKKKIAEIIKGAVAEATKMVSAGYENQIAALQAEIDELGAQPDPAQAPMRGVVAVRKNASTTDEPAPVERTSLVEKAQAQATAAKEEEVAFLTQFLNHPDPAMRESAEGRLRRLLATP